MDFINKFVSPFFFFGPVSQARTLLITFSDQLAGLLLCVEGYKSAVWDSKGERMEIYACRNWDAWFATLQESFLSLSSPNSNYAWMPQDSILILVLILGELRTTGFLWDVTEMVPAPSPRF